MQSVCPDYLGYKINAMNCGVCGPDTILNNTSITCVLSDVFTSSGNFCSFSVETIVCGSNGGNKSDEVTAILKGMANAEL